VKSIVFSIAKFPKLGVPNSSVLWTAQGGQMGKIRFVFGKDMTDEQMWQAFKKFAEGCGFTTRDTHTKKKAKKSRQGERRAN
jgi:proline dehydrogenase